MVSKVSENPTIWSISVPLPQNPLRSLNSYVIQSREESLIVDTGFHRPECSQALWEGLDVLKLNLSKTALFLTHLHSDHIGLVQDFVDRGCPVYMNGIDYQYFCGIKSGTMWPFMEDLFCIEGFPKDEIALQKTENQGRLYAPERVFPAVQIADGDLLHVGGVEIKCIHTPGHTPGHTVLYLPKSQILLSGDHILFDITPNISVWKDVPHSLADYISSLEKIRALPICQTLPAHRSMQLSTYDRIDAIIAHHHERLKEILSEVMKKPGQDAYTIASRISWSARGRAWTEFSPHQKWFAVGEALAHLYDLVDRGRVCRRIDGDTAAYFPG